MSNEDQYGNTPICNVCEHQFHAVDDPAHKGCREPTAEFESDTCTTYFQVSHSKLALRVAELYGQVAIAWDTILAILDLSTKLPEVKE